MKTWVIIVLILVVLAAGIIVTVVVVNSNKKKKAMSFSLNNALVGGNSTDIDTSMWTCNRDGFLYDQNNIKTLHRC
jgi:flagellar basal body-associated protein FliL